ARGSAIPPPSRRNGRLRRDRSYAACLRSWRPLPIRRAHRAPSRFLIELEDLPMARIVMKFGGTSMAGIERIRNVANRVKHEADAGNEVAVVVSAMAGETDRLVGFCREAAALHDTAEYDVVVASGEQVTSGLLAITLQAIGVPARSWLG